MLLYSTLAGGIALFEVGPEKTSFSVHKELLCDCSGRYKKIFAGREKLDLKVNARYIFREESLSAVQTDMFTELIGWMYRGSLSTALERRVSFTFLFELWILANFFFFKCLTLKLRYYQPVSRRMRLFNQFLSVLFTIGRHRDHRYGSSLSICVLRRHLRFNLRRLRMNFLWNAVAIFASS